MDRGGEDKIETSAWSTGCSLETEDFVFEMEVYDENEVVMVAVKDKKEQRYIFEAIWDGFKKRFV